MPHFNWDYSYSVKVKRFDDDHRKLFSILNQLHDGMMTGRGQEVLQSVLSELLTYTERHFGGEEQVLRNLNYPQLPAHSQQHRTFEDRIKDVSARYQAGGIGITLEVLDFLTDWLKKHINCTDKQYSEFLNIKGIA